MKVKISIRNRSNEKMCIIKEPEALEGFIEADDEIKIETNCVEDNILINIGKNEDGTIYVQIWDAANTSYVVFRGGEDMFAEYFD